MIKAKVTKRKNAQRCSLVLEIISEESCVLRSVDDCKYCRIKRFSSESPNFYCSGKIVSLVSHAIPYSLQRLFTDRTEKCVHFRNNIRTYNNNFAFTSLGAKYFKELTKNSHGMYTFRVQS